MVEKASSKSELRDVRFIVRLLGSERQAFQDAADLAGIPLSAWVRSRLRQSAIKELEAQALSIAFLPDKTLE
jgi:ribosomal protein S11